MPFTAVPADLARALEEQGYAEPTPVQAAVLQPETAERDLLVSAQTGSGKTVAYALAMASTLLEDRSAFEHAREPRALIVAPTRELALQVHRELSWLYKHVNARLATCVGGMDIRREQRTLDYGPQIVVGTPGRLRDHLERGNLNLSALQVAVLDEADEMLDLGFREDLEFLLDAAAPERRTLLFSATIPKEIATLARRYQRDAQRIVTSSGTKSHADIDYRAIRVAPNDVEHAIVNVLRYFEARGAMIFCSTRESVRSLYGNLLERGFAAVALSGELSQNERNHALQALRDGRARVCVATDVAARGIDLPDLGLVIHADLPNNRDTLLHRSGRTGRAGRKGVCVLLVPHTRRRRAEQLLDAARIDVTWMAPPTADAIRTQDQQRLAAEVSTGETPTDEERAAARALLELRGAEDIAVALIRQHRLRLPAPEELLDSADSALDSSSRAPGAKEKTRPAFGESVWFRINVGRNGNADPRWLLPLICRRGHVTKREIGAIRIFDRETKFEIATAVAEKFLAAASRPDEKDEGIRIDTAGAPPAQASRERSDDRPKKSYGAKPYAGKSGEKHRAKPDGKFGKSRYASHGDGQSRGGGKFQGARKAYKSKPHRKTPA